MSTPPGPQPLEPGCYPTRDNEEVRRLLAAKNEARARWRETHVALDSATRRDPDVALEVHDTHLAAPPKPRTSPHASASLHSRYGSADAGRASRAL